MSKNDDTISRQDAIETSLKFFIEFLGGAFHENAQKELIARFQRLSSAEPTTGVWNRLSHDTFHCNLCGHTFIVLQGDDAMNYCPNCGTYMTKESEENYDYERAVDQMEHDISYESTYNPEDGSM